MSTVWREYGVIGVLMVAAISGYLWLSRNPVDIVAQSLDTLSQHLLSLVPEAEGRERVESSLVDFRRKVETQEVTPEQVERFAASVMNLASAGEPLDAADAELVVRIALQDPSALPVPKEVQRRSPPPKPEVEADAWEALGERLEPMVAFYRHVRSDIPADSARSVGLRFYAQDGMRVVVDDRYRERFAEAEAAKALIEDRAVSWRAHFEDATQADRERQMARATKLMSFTLSKPDSGATLNVDTVAIRATLAGLASLRRLESLGVLTEGDLDSLAARLEADVENLVRQSILVTVVPPPPPPPPAATATSRPRSRVP